MISRSWTEDFLVYQFLSAACQLISDAPAGVEPGGTQPHIDVEIKNFTPSTSSISTTSFSVRLEMSGDDFAVFTIETAAVTSDTFTPALHRVLRRHKVDRSIVEMAALPGTMCYRIFTDLLTKAS